MNTGDKVTDRNGNIGTITMADDTTVCILWTSKMQGSFNRKHLAANGITPMPQPKPVADRNYNGGF